MIVEDIFVVEISVDGGRRWEPQLDLAQTFPPLRGDSTCHQVEEANRLKGEKVLKARWTHYKRTGAFTQ